MVERFKHNCEICGGEFFRSPSDGPVRFYCSPHCARTAQRGKAKERAQKKNLAILIAADKEAQRLAIAHLAAGGSAVFDCRNPQPLLGGPQINLTAEEAEALERIRSGGDREVVLPDFLTGNT